MRDPYAVLGVGRGATPDQIKKAYRNLAKKHHPDLNPGEPRAAERFKEVAAAYELLSDPRSRASFDRTGATSTRREVHRDEAVTAFLAAFQQQVPLMADLFVQEILPRYIERYYRGRGVRLVHQLLDDIERHRILEQVNGPAPGEQARELAARVARECPVAWRPEHIVDDRGKPVLGRMLQGLTVGSRGLGWRSRIELFAGSFHAAGHRAPEVLGAAILPVIATEYVRYLELWLPQELRPVVAREGQAAGWGGRRLDLAQATRADSVFLARRYGGFLALASLLLLLIWAVLAL